MPNFAQKPMKIGKRLIQKSLKTFGYSLIATKEICRLRLRSLSFSQFGEDSIIDLIVGLSSVPDFTYLDIGANDPYKFNNTSLFYHKGFSGVNVEPDPAVFESLRRERPRDVNVNMGVAAKPGTLTLFLFQNSMFNTFCKETAAGFIDRGAALVGEKSIPVTTYTELVERHLGGRPPTLLSLDAEGMDEEILDSINYSEQAPSIICVETYCYGKSAKNRTLVEKMAARNYEPASDTFVNTIFTHRNLHLSG
jgi:FkbM family methyltransferase